MNRRHLLQRHPIPMTCHFEHSLVVTWALPAGTLEPLVPPGLTLDTYDSQWGFVVIAVVQTRNLRPAFLPGWAGSDYALTGYRIFVRHRDRTGRTRRGLHILRSDTDRRTMKLGGNLLTHYRYRLSGIDIGAAPDRLDVRITTRGAEADLHVVARLAAEPAPLPPTSPFRSARDARRFAGPLPWTFDYEPQTRSIVMIRARRTAWDPQPTAVDIKTCSFLERAPFSAARPRLASAFHVGGVDYSWERGIRTPIGLS
jgi:Uncharacterized conserved protein (COG2071)